MRDRYARDHLKTWLELGYGWPDGLPCKRKRSGNSKARRKRWRLLKIDPRCFYCRARLTLDTSTLDHLHPKSRGGTTTVLACLTCNRDKGAMTLEEFME